MNQKLVYETPFPIYEFTIFSIQGDKQQSKNYIFGDVLIKFKIIFRKQSNNIYELYFNENIIRIQMDMNQKMLIILQFSCPFCSQAYNDTQRIPMMICFNHHLCCLRCLNKLFQNVKMGDVINCHFCSSKIERATVQRFRSMDNIHFTTRKIPADREMEDIMRQNQTLKKELSAEREINQKITEKFKQIEGALIEKFEKRARELYKEIDTLNQNTEQLIMKLQLIQRKLRKESEQNIALKKLLRVNKRQKYIVGIDEEQYIADDKNEQIGQIKHCERKSWSSSINSNRLLKFLFIILAIAGFIIWNNPFEQTTVIIEKPKTTKVNNQFDKNTKQIQTVLGNQQNKLELITNQPTSQINELAAEASQPQLQQAKQTKQQKSQDKNKVSENSLPLEGSKYFKNTSLQFNRQNITSIDVSMYPRLVKLYIYETNITTINLTNNKNIALLNANKNQINSIDLASNHRLNYLSIQQNNLSSIDLTHNPQLTYVNFKKNNLKSIKTDQNVNLVSLQLQQNQITSINLIQNIKLVNLYIHKNRLNAIQLKNCPNLEVLYLSQNNISSIQVDKNTKLKKLWLQDNKLTEIDITQNKELFVLNLAHNRLKEIDLSQNNKLEYIRIGENQLQSINMTKSPYLSQLILYYNKLEVIDLTSNTGLKDFSISSNAIESIDLTKNINLTSFRLQNNQLESIDLTKNIQLQVFNLESNQLTSIDLSYNVQLKQVLLSNNQLKKVSIYCSPKLKLFDIRNQLSSSCQVNFIYKEGNFNYCNSLKDSMILNYKNMGHGHYNAYSCTYIFKLVKKN